MGFGLTLAVALLLASGDPAEGPSACSRKIDAGIPAIPRGPGAGGTIDITYYRLDLRITPPPSSLRGRVTVAATSLVDTLTAVSLNLSSPMVVDSVQIEGEPAAFSRGVNELLLIALDRTYARNENLTMRIVYHGTPVSTGFGSFEFASDGGSPWVWSLSESYGARDWWPCKDHQTDKADSVDVVVTCQTGLRVGSNGRLISVVDNGDGTSTHTWSERHPIATYLVSVALGDYNEFSNWFHYGPTDSMQVLNYVLPRHLDDALAVLPRTVAMLEQFSEQFGLYPFVDEKYGHAEFGKGGAMEHQTMTSTTNFNEYTIAHELAHQWFGDLITCASWRDLWLNEGFASYAEALYAERTYGVTAYLGTIRRMLDRAKDAAGPLYLADTSSIGVMFAYSGVYAKGASVLHMLRHLIGDSLFFRTLRTYVADPRFRYGVATTEDFLSVCQDVSGKNLRWFFDQWVYGEGYPHYEFSWTTRQSGSGTEAIVQIGQLPGFTQPEVFTMPLEIRFSTETRETTVVVAPTAGVQEFTVPLSFLPDIVSLDPDERVLRDVRQPAPPIPAAFQIDQNFPNPFNPTTTIRVHIPRRSRVAIAVYDLLGRQVVLLSDGVMEPGQHTLSWNGHDTDGRPAASGVYVCRLVAGSLTRETKMVIVR